MDLERKQEYFIQPWLSPSEFIQCYKSIFPPPQTQTQLQASLEDYISSLSIPNLLQGLKKLIIWQSRNDNKAFTLSSFLLLNCIIKIKSNEYNNNLDTCHILSETIIRVINLIIDELKKTKKTSNANMLLVAKDIDLPECIIETRHACTHKNLPHYNTLIFTIKFLFLWVKNKMWDKQYEIYIHEQQYYECIMAYLNNSNSKSKKYLFKEFNANIHLEINHLMEIIVLLFKLIKNKLQIGKKKLILSENIDIAITIYKQLQKTESCFSFLMIYLFISQQMLLIIKEDIIKKDIRKYDKEIEILSFFAKFTTKYFTIKINNHHKENKTLIDKIYINIYQAVQYSSAFTEILNSYLLILKDYHFDHNIIDKDFDLKDIYLYQLGSIPIEDNDYSLNKLKPIDNDSRINENDDIAMKIEDTESVFIQEYPNTLIL